MHNLKSFAPLLRLSLEELVTGLVIIYEWVAPISPAQVEAINLQALNSPDLL